MNINEISSLALQSQAAYAILGTGDFGPQLATTLTAQENAAFTVSQAQQFAAKHSVVLQYDDTSPGGNNTGLSLTVFRDISTNQLTLAIRGTTDAADWSSATTSIMTSGAGYGQIAALHNWWQRASATSGTLVPQYVVSVTDLGDPNALVIPGGYLVRRADVAATGELVGAGALSSDPDQRLDVTGHSLGGHLAMAFAALFGASASSVTTFNAPGFIDNFYNRDFFAQLGGVLPTLTAIGAMTTNVIADEARKDGGSFSPIAGAQRLCIAAGIAGALAGGAARQAR
jgi:Lipase (class 3)